MKFVIDGNSLGQLAEALAGVSLQKGVKAGLQNQKLGAELDKMRFEQDRAFRQQQARDSLLGGKIAAMFPNESARTHENLAYALGGAKPVRGFRYDENGGLMKGAGGLPLPDDGFGLPESLLRSDGLAAKAGLLREYADTARQLEAFGLDGAAAAKLWGGVEERLRQNELGRLGMEYAAAGNNGAMNRIVSLQTGKHYLPYAMDGNGYYYNKDGSTPPQATELAVAKTAATNNLGALYLDKGQKERAQAGYFDAKTETEPYVRQELVAKANNQNAGAGAKMAQTALYGAQQRSVEQKMLRDGTDAGYMYDPATGGMILMPKPPQGAVKFRPPNNNEVAAYFTKTDAMGQKVIDYAEMRRAIDFAQRRGFADVTAARQDYQAWRNEAERLGGGNETAVIEQAAAFAPSNQLGAAAAQNLPPVTDYDRKAGALGKPGTPRFGEQTALLEAQARKLGLVLRRGDGVRAQQALRALYERGVIPRDHVQVLWEYYAGAQKAAPKKK